LRQTKIVLKLKFIQRRSDNRRWFNLVETVILIVSSAIAAGKSKSVCDLNRKEKEKKREKSAKRILLCFHMQIE